MISSFFSWAKAAGSFCFSTASTSILYGQSPESRDHNCVQDLWGEKSAKQDIHNWAQNENEKFKGQPLCRGRSRLLTWQQSATDWGSRMRPIHMWKKYKEVEGGSSRHALRSPIEKLLARLFFSRHHWYNDYLIETSLLLAKNL